MTLVENLESPHGKTVELKVDLFPKGHYYINNERLTITEYQKKKTISFSELVIILPRLGNLSTLLCASL